MEWLLAVILWMACGAVAWVIANNKGHSGCDAAGCGCIFGIFGILYAALMPNVRDQRQLKCLDCGAPYPRHYSHCPVVQHEGKFNCPSCRELCIHGAQRCWKCGTEFEYTQ